MTELDGLFKALKDLTESIKCQPSCDELEEELKAADEAIESFKRKTITEAAESAIDNRT